jgi:hypothetical protein
VPHTPEEKTWMEMQPLSSAVSCYLTDNGPPASSENNVFTETLFGIRPPHKAYLEPSSYIVQNSNHELIDGWGTPLRFVFKGKNDFLIISAGPDKIFGTADDITNH